jgi:uncharacterized repeat protein (TIGR03806 family)
MNTQFNRTSACLGRLVFWSTLIVTGALCWQSAKAGLPTGWSDANIGNPGQGGSATDVNGLWTVSGGGADIWGSADQFNFVSESVAGDGSAIAEVLTVQNSDPTSGWSKAGIMFRNDVTAGSANVAVVATAGQGVSFQWRTSANGTSNYANKTGLTPPIWVKLTRAGTSFSAYYSANGTTWTQVGTTQTVNLNSGILAGLAVTAHNNSALNTSTFTNVSVGLTVPIVTLPVITNLPALNVQAISATLAGQVITNGNQNPAVTLYYGQTDGGANPAAWSNSIAIGPQASGYNFTVTGLATNTTYYFTARATNSAGIVWASPSQTFTTLSTPTAPPQGILTYQFDNTRVGANTNEFLLTPANVNVNNFGRLFSYPVDGYVFGEPLVVTNVAIPGAGVHDVLYIATEHDTVYAFDADNYVPTPYWTNSFINAAAGVIPVPGGDAQGNIQPEVGITATPVIDPATGTLYVEARTKETSGANVSYVHRLHALDIRTGQERTDFNSPVVISATNYPGQGSPGYSDTNSAGNLLWNGLRENCRPALLLANGRVYVAYADPGDYLPYYGWVMGYDAHSLAQTGVFNDDPNGGYGGVWMSGAGLAADPQGYIYMTTGNGDFDGTIDFGDSILKLQGTNGLSVADYFTPYNQDTLNSQDLDLGSSGVIVLPDSVGNTNHPHLLLSGSKTGTLYLMDRDNMGKYNTVDDSQIVQEISGAVGGMWSAPAFFNGLVYIIGKSDYLKVFPISGGAMATTAIAQSTSAFGYCTPTISANGTNNSIVWALNASGGSALLHAFNGTNVAQELYNSNQNPGRDNPGPAVEFTVPAVVNGKVYVGYQHGVAVYGTASFLATPIIAPNGGLFTNSVTVSIADVTPGVSLYYTLDGSQPTASSTPYTVPFVLTNSANVQAVAVKAGAVNSAVASASFINSSSVGTGVGLLGSYWANTTSTAFTNVTFSAAPTLVRTDAVINFNWNSAGPDPSIGQTVFAVRWTGSVQPQFSETYTFTATTDDGVRLWVNGQLLANNWKDQAATASQGSITLKAQQLYNIRMEYYQNGGGASAELQWSSPSTPLADIPQSQLYPYTNPPPTIALTSPTNNASYLAYASVTLAAAASAPHNPLSGVDFYANGTYLGTVTNAPYTLTTTGLAPGGYSLTAVAKDGSGLITTSAPVTISVSTGSGSPYGLTARAAAPPFLNMPTSFTGPIPLLLSQTGIFSNTPAMTPIAGMVPYQPNVPLWSDGALKIRYVCVPFNGGTLTPDQQITFAPTGSWTFPPGTVFVKTFELATNETDPNSILRLETRLLVRDTNGQVYGVTYKWRPDNSEADLLTSSVTQAVTIATATGSRTQTWYYPSPADCLKCHTQVADYVLGVNTRQLNGNLTYPASGVTDNQLRALNRAGLLNPAFSESAIAGFEKLSALTNQTVSLQERARSYLDANCAQCHQPGGPGPSFDARYETPLANQNITNYPASFSLGYDRACIVKGGDIWRSVIYGRMNALGTIQMPPLARNLIDTNAVQLFGAWINTVPGVPALAPATIAPAGGTFAPSVQVALQSTNNNATIYYTLDGSLPTTSSFAYVAPFTLTNNAMVVASAFENNFDNSLATRAQFVVVPGIALTSGGYASSNVFVLGFNSVASNSYVLQATTNLVNWIPISTNLALTNSLQLVDPHASNFQYRYYRIMQQ